jgi:hypothetical protein
MEIHRNARKDRVKQLDIILCVIVNYGNIEKDKEIGKSA